MKRKIEFSDKELIEALEYYFKIPKGKITFWYIRSIVGNGHIVEYRE